MYLAGQQQKKAIKLCNMAFKTMTTATKQVKTGLLAAVKWDHNRERKQRAQVNKSLGQLLGEYECISAVITEVLNDIRAALKDKEADFADIKSKLDALTSSIGKLNVVSERLSSQSDG